MKIIQTFWSGPSTKSDNQSIKNAAGWLSSEYHWMSWTLSCLQLHKKFGSVELVTDENGRNVLAGLLALPYSNVNIGLEGRLDHYPKELWALAKIFTYNLQDGPFIHFDGDVFIWDEFNNDFMNADIVAQNAEVNLPYYGKILDQVGIYFKYIPDELKRIIESKANIYACNTGVFGGTDITFIKDYCKVANTMIDCNIEQLNKIYLSDLNCIFEQCLLYYLAQSKDKNIYYLVKEVIDSPLYLDFVRFADIPQIQMVHTVNGYKKNPFICEQLSKRLRNEYPDYYYHIIDLYRSNGIELMDKIYNLPRSRSHFLPIASISKKTTLGNISSENNPTIKNNGIDNPSLSKSIKPFFVRTICYLNYKHLDTSILDDCKNICQLENEINRRINRVGISEMKKQLKEIFNLEKKEYLISREIQNPGVIEALYYKDNIHFSDTDSLFKQSENEMLNTTISVNEDVTFFEHFWKWTPNSKEQPIKEFIEQTIAIPPSLIQLIVIADTLKLEIKEIQLDDLDYLIVNSFKEKQFLHKAIEELKINFEIEEIARNQENYRFLIVNSVKRLLYAGVLSLN